MKVDFHGDPNIGMYAVCNDSMCVLGAEMSSFSRLIEKILGVEVLLARIGGTSLVRLFCVMNENSLIVPKIVEDHELDHLRCLEKYGISVYVLESDYTALGNLISCNDKGAVASKLLKEKDVKTVGKALKVKTAVSSLAGLDTIGSCSFSNDNGCLVHPSSEDEEVKVFEKTLGVKCEKTTVGGSPFLRASLIANCKGFIVGENASGLEISLIKEVLL